MEDLDEGKVGCGIFCRPSKSLWHILLAKLDYYGICGVANDWFRSFLSDRRQFVSINEFNSNHAMLKDAKTWLNLMFYLSFLENLS